MLCSAQFCVLDFTIMDVPNLIYFQNHIQNWLHTFFFISGLIWSHTMLREVSCLYTYIYIYYRSKLWGWKEYNFFLKEVSYAYIWIFFNQFYFFFRILWWLKHSKEESHLIIAAEWKYYFPKFKINQWMIKNSRSL